MLIKIAMSFIFKMVTYKNGALALFSSSISAGLVFYMGVLLQGTETRLLVIPIFTHLIGFAFFFMFVLLDLATGLWNAKFQNETSENPKSTYIKSHRLYRTLWKTLGVMLLNTMIMVTCLFSEIMKGEYLYTFTLWAMVVVWIMACGFEFHSIGENIEKRTGTKPEIFSFLDRILSIVEKKAIRKVENLFKDDEDHSGPNSDPEGNKENIN